MPEPATSSTVFDTPKPSKLLTKKSKHNISLLKLDQKFYEYNCR